MENDIELFDRYIGDDLDAAGKEAFEARLRSDRSFALDFRVYLFTLLGMREEAEQENIEFGTAMKNISGDELLRIIGRRDAPGHRRLRMARYRERLAWAASVVAILACGIWALIGIRQQGMDRVDDIIVAYNDIPEFERSGPSADDVQYQQEAGMRQAMDYLKEHDRRKAKALLTELSVRFADDVEFAAQCRTILRQLE